MSEPGFFDVVAARRSVRAFQDRPVEPEKLNRILEAANLAPSAGDLQAYEIVVVRDPEARKRLAKAALGQWFIAEAPVNLVFLANPARSARRYGGRGAELYCIQDATIAAAYAQLAAHALGLGSVWVGAFHDDEVREVVGAGRDLKPVAIITIGYPAEKPRATPRRRIEDLVSSERFGTPYREYEVTDPKMTRPEW